METICRTVYHRQEPWPSRSHLQVGYSNRFALFSGVALLQSAYLGGSAILPSLENKLLGQPLYKRLGSIKILLKW